MKLDTKAYFTVVDFEGNYVNTLLARNADDACKKAAKKNPMYLPYMLSAQLTSVYAPVPVTGSRYQ